jgi:tetratricopeptide (TPR) repeat protein
MMHRDVHWISPRFGVLAAALLMAMLVGGCAKILKPKAVITPHTQPTAAAPVESAPNEEEAATPRLSLSAIVNRDLQNGHYAEGEKALRRYLQDHPGDRTAQSYLRQLTDDPKKLLGASSTPHIVQPGESYSTLAAKYLGDANLFLALARYNGSTNPALILVGSTLKLPMNASVAAAAASAQPVPATAPVSTPTIVATPPPSASAPPAQSAQQLESQSLALYRQGHKDQAVATFDKALALNPQLKSSDPNFAALSRIWVANTHQQAMVLYLDQHLDQAIALWNRILMVDPGYEPAVVYRTRAMELKQRLQQY